MVSPHDPVIVQHMVRRDERVAWLYEKADDDTHVLVAATEVVAAISPPAELHLAPTIIHMCSCGRMRSKTEVRN